MSFYMTKTITKYTDIEAVIYMVRGHRVMLDEDLANMYGVETRVLNQAIRRNKDRFPKDSMFQLTKEEFSNLMSQIVISSWGGRRKRPFVFTEHGTVMLASVLRSKRAIKVNIEVVKAFVSLRRILSSQKNILRQITEIRSFILKQSNKTDLEFRRIWKMLDRLTNIEKGSENKIGFKLDK